jgi:glycosyltransferase involved in cell wall biosynthesis
MVELTRHEGPHVVMLVNNNVTSDNRVLKSALSLVRGGLRVTVLGITRSGRQQEIAVGGAVRVLLLPVEPARAGSPAERVRWVTSAVQRRAANRLPVRSWRVALPIAGLLKKAFAPMLDELAPDVVHTHDVHLLGVATRWVSSARQRAHRPHLLYDAHELVSGLAPSAKRPASVIRAWAALEAEFIGHADRVITVSPLIAERLMGLYGLPDCPDVVLNAPVVFDRPNGSTSPVRMAAGVSPSARLLVYSGSLAAPRGVDSLISALPYLPPDHHVAILAVPYPNPYGQHLVHIARAIGVSDRVHLVPPVASHRVVDHLRGADVGVHPMWRGPNHDLALPNKLFEYLHAGLDLAVSDCDAMADFVREHRLGEVFRAGEAADLAAAVQRLAERPGCNPRERANLAQQFTWQRQELVLWSVYRDLLGCSIGTSSPWDRETFDTEVAV